jgi:(2Fe-2S) ferredoxin
MNSISQPDNFSTTPSSDPPKCVRVCQNRTCRKQGAKKVLTAFEALPVPGVIVTGSGCLGQCGNGPIVLVLPDMVWYCGVHPSEVPFIVEQDLPSRTT